MNNKFESNQLWTIKDIAEYCGISRATAFRYKKEDGTFPSAIKLSTKTVRYVRDEVILWVNGKFQ